MTQLTGRDPSLLRRINSAVTLHALRGADALTLTQLMEDTGLSRPTVEGVVEGLTRQGLVAEVDPDAGAPRRGRPARRYRFRAEAGHLLGLEVGVRAVRGVLADLGGTVVGTLRRDVHQETAADERLGAVRALVADLLRRSGVPRGNLRAVGLGTPGIIGADGAVELCAAVPGWTGLDLGARLRRSFRCPVLVENDANLAAIGEHWKGAAVGADSMVFVLAGLSPGAGSLINGRLHRGFGGAAGEIGALHLLGRQADPEHLLSTTDTPLRPLDEQAVAGVLRRAAEGDAEASEALDRFVERLSHDVAALVLAIDPEVVVIGGWATGLDGLLEPLRARLAGHCLRAPRVALTELGEEAVALGALRTALDHVERELFAVDR
ncbi:ROK family protein [Allostreptomyces psammosilenae]|uniref:Putative NBD/HSP70 family sugar kinase n=1 Tax=Allostreptomyces psammosilenae TaxID=1892865 RepID=A0A853A1J6_9ACTN|nr:ROK family protein [Allostreptomyces psammosilenae]NYI04392.1 putative NBD/HSP70 family sugar kinase [Allostreptomyces psammosilenae]